jgi:phosphoglycerate dehydrogenase-like enzyme
MKIITGLWLTLLSAVGAVAVAAAAESQRLDLPTALAEFQLPESGRSARELVPGWVAPRRMVVMVDKPERTAWLQEAMPAGVTVVGVKAESEIAPLLAEADALVDVDCGAAKGNAPKLRWVHAASGGGDTCLVVERIARGDTLLTTSQKVKNTGLAEMGIGFMFALARDVDVLVANQQQRDLSRRGGRPGLRLEGSTMLIVGLGGAGTEIARMAHAMGMKVIATDPVNRNPPDFVSHVGLPEDLPSLIGQADVVMVAAPLTPQTRGMFNTALFQRMKRTAMLINWARADIVVAEDLAAALKAGTIGSAALNWATNEPLPKDHPLWDAPNLILAPWGGMPPGTSPRDISASAARTMELRWFVLRENMRRFATGDKMYSVFDLTRGY